MSKGLNVRKLDAQMLHMLGRRIAIQRARMGDKGWSQTDLGERADLKQGTISVIENGGRENLPLSSVLAIAEALEVSLDYLIYGEEGPPWKSAGRETTPVSERREQRQVL